MFHHKKELQTTRWDRVYVDYSLLERVIAAKEFFGPKPQVKKPLSIQSTVNVK